MATIAVELVEASINICVDSAEEAFIVDSAMDVENGERIFCEAFRFLNATNRLACCATRIEEWTFLIFNDYNNCPYIFNASSTYED